MYWLSPGYSAAAGWIMFRQRGFEGFDRKDAEFLQCVGDAVERSAALAQAARDLRGVDDMHGGAGLHVGHFRQRERPVFRLHGRELGGRPSRRPRG